MATMSNPTSFRQVDGFDVHCLYTENDFLHKENQRLRIAHLRRMAELAEGWGGHMVNENEEHIDLHPNYAKTVSDGRRLIRFTEACNREIARLRGEG